MEKKQFDIGARECLINGIREGVYRVLTSDGAQVIEITGDSIWGKNILYYFAVMSSSDGWVVIECEAYHAFVMEDKEGLRDPHPFHPIFSPMFPDNLNITLITKEDSEIQSLYIDPGNVSFPPQCMVSIDWVDDVEEEKLFDPRFAALGINKRVITSSTIYPSFDKLQLMSNILTLGSFDIKSTQRLFDFLLNRKSYRGERVDSEVMQKNIPYLNFILSASLSSVEREINYKYGR